jgi:hypothetical protein
MAAMARIGRRPPTLLDDPLLRENRMTSIQADATATEVAMPWFRSEDWSQWKAVLADGHRLPEDYRAWFFRVELVRRRLERDGTKVELIVMDPETFIGWCRTHDLTPNADSGWRFAAETRTSRSA